MGRYYGAYIGISEYVHSNLLKNVLQTYLLSLDALTSIIIGSYYEKISKNWEWLQLFCIGVQILGMTLLFWIPESPEYLYSVNRFEESKKVLKQIAKYNRAKDFPDKFSFDTELDM